MGHDTKHHTADECRNENEINHEDLIGENLTVLTETVMSLSKTMDMLIQKTASMAYHIIATEEILAEIVVEHGLNLVHVNERIRTKIINGTDNQGDSNVAIDIAASITSRLVH